MDCQDLCISDPQKQAPGVCGCGKTDADLDADGVLNCNDECPQDPLKTIPGIAGCGKSDTDADGDGTPDSLESCPNDKAKLIPGVCGCGVVDQDSDKDGTADCLDQCAQDALKQAPGACGCGVADTDRDGDGTADCVDQCPSNPLLTVPLKGSCVSKPLPPSAADLYINDVSSAYGTVKRGQSWSFTGKADNVGTAKSNASTVTWYLSPDKTLSVKSDVKLGAARIKALEPGEFQAVKLKVSGKLTSKVAAGKYWLIGTISDEMNVSEIARANNLTVSARQITVKK
jgi:hypothetical protein